MAKAERKLPNDFEVVLTLSKAEAEVLWKIIRKVGGNPDGKRLCVDRIERALGAIEGLEHKYLESITSGHIDFTG